MDELESLLSEYSKPDLEVPLHKQFEILKFGNKLDKCSREQAIQIAKLVYKAMVINHHSMLELLKHNWFSEEELKKAA